MRRAAFVMVEGVAAFLTALPSPATAQAPRLISPPDLEAHVQRPVVSPRGHMVAFEVSVSGQRKELHVVSISGGRPVAISPGAAGSRFGGAVEWVCHEATWDPSGRDRLVFSCGERGAGNYDLYVAELFGDRAAVTRLTRDDANEGGPA